MNRFVVLDNSVQICAVLREFHECFPGLLDRIDNIDQYAKKLSESAFVVVMNKDDENVGLCCYYANDLKSFTGYIALIGIKNAFQGTGHGKELLDFICNECRKSHMKKLKLEVDMDNERAITFYKRNGFMIISKAREESYYMEIEL